MAWASKWYIDPSNTLRVPPSWCVRPASLTVPQQKDHSQVHLWHQRSCARVEQLLSGRQKRVMNDGLLQLSSAWTVDRLTKLLRTKLLHTYVSLDNGQTYEIQCVMHATDSSHSRSVQGNLH